MTIREFILNALEYKPISASTALKILQRVLKRLGYRTPKALPEPQEHVR